MSAFIVHPEHINVLIWTRLQRVGHSGPLRWHFDNPTDIRELTPGNATQVGRMLLDEHRIGEPSPTPSATGFATPSVLGQPGTPTARSWYAKYPAAQGIRRRGDSYVARGARNRQYRRLPAGNDRRQPLRHRRATGPGAREADCPCRGDVPLNLSRARHCLILAGPVPLEAGGQVP